MCKYVLIPLGVFHEPGLWLSPSIAYMSSSFSNYVIFGATSWSRSEKQRAYQNEKSRQVKKNVSPTNRKVLTQKNKRVLNNV